MTSIVDECLKSISQINQNDLDGEMAVCESMLESYEKIFSLMEHYSDDDLSSLPFFESVIPTVTIQEAEAGADNSAQDKSQPETNTQNDDKQDKNDNKEKLWEFNPRGKNEKTGRKEHILKSIFLFIPRLILAVGRFIYRWIKSLFNRKGEVEQATKEVTNNLEKVAEQNPLFFENPDLIQKLIEEMNDKDDYPAFTFVKQKNIQKTQGQNGVMTDEFGFVLYPALNIDDLIDNLKSYDTNILKVYATELSKIIKLVTTPNGDDSVSLTATKLTNEMVSTMTTTLKEFATLMQDEYRVANAIRVTQKSSKTLVVKLSTGQSNENYKMPANLLWNKFSDINKLIDIITKDDEAIVNIVKTIETTETYIVTPEDGAIEGLKSMLSDLKNATTLLLNQVKLIADLTDGYLKGIINNVRFHNFEYLSEKVAKLLGNQNPQQKGQTGESTLPGQEPPNINNGAQAAANAGNNPANPAAAPTNPTVANPTNANPTMPTVNPVNPTVANPAPTTPTPTVANPTMPSVNPVPTVAPTGAVNPGVPAGANPNPTVVNPGNAGNNNAKAVAEKKALILKLYNTTPKTTKGSEFWDTKEYTVSDPLGRPGPVQYYFGPQEAFHTFEGRMHRLGNTVNVIKSRNTTVNLDSNNNVVNEETGEPITDVQIQGVITESYYDLYNQDDNIEPLEY